MSRARTALLATRAGIAAVESGLIPDALVRSGIRMLIRSRLRDLERGGVEAQQERLESWIASMAASPIAATPEAANAQHYEVPAEFFQAVLGAHLKYSAALWEPGTDDLDAAEAAMLALTARRADLRDGQRILELGCGWGSLTLDMAATLPAARILAVSNSLSQADFIRRRCRERGLANVEVVTADINAFEPRRVFDRIVSVEMFEHVRNWRALLARVAGWLVPDGLLFVHVFCHGRHAYPVEVEGADDWMGRHFFTGGHFPSDGLLARHQDHLRLERQWRVSGTHYQRTAEAWLENLDRNRARAEAALAAGNGPEHARLWLRRWRVFFMACAELFGYRDGGEWWVCHHVMRRR